MVMAPFSLIIIVIYYIFAIPPSLTTNEQNFSYLLVLLLKSFGQEELNHIEGVGIALEPDKIN